MEVLVPEVKDSSFDDDDDGDDSIEMVGGRIVSVTGITFTIPTSVGTTLR
jgi:hypothetical protein